MKSFRKSTMIILLSSAFLSISSTSNAMVIGYYDDTRELYGLSTGYLDSARQALLDMGHTLVSTNNANAAFLGTVDAFYTGLIGSVSADEINAMESFVNVTGGFLFIQQDHDLGPWHAPSSQILANWGIGNSAGSYDNDSGHYTVSGTAWVTDPNIVTGFSGSAHSTINVIPVGFEVVAYDDQNRAIMGVFDAGAGRSSDVFVATDIDFWSTGGGYGFDDIRNRKLWENIWQGAARQIDPDPNPVPEPATLGLFGLGLLGLTLRRKHI